MGVTSEAKVLWNVPAPRLDQAS
ncbi:protein of unknown function [Pseudomonas mediterranea]